MTKTAIITGASSGFGEAIARHLASLGINLVLGARRVERLEKISKEIQKTSKAKVIFHELDVQNSESVQKFAQAAKKQFTHIDYLINNAGLALETDSIVNSKEENWQKVWDTNVLGCVRMIQQTVPLMKPHAGCRVVNIGSIAGLETYEGGGPYTSSKFGLRSVTLTLRYELLEKGIGVSSVDPGMAETEFSNVRFKGDTQKAKKVYEGMSPLLPQDIAEIVGFIVTRPDHVNLDQVLVLPTSQGSAKRIVRKV
jgi:3-hydroxy acid dehydrogenase/malonic semialdehyde reductase